MAGRTLITVPAVGIAAFASVLYHDAGGSALRRSETKVEPLEERGITVRANAQTNVICNFRTSHFDITAVELTVDQYVHCRLPHAALRRNTQLSSVDAFGANA